MSDQFWYAGCLLTVTAQLAAELRIPVPRLNTHAYVFGEAGSDLGSSPSVPGNPTEYFRRAGAGAAVGAGIRLASVRTEFIRDLNSGTGSLFLRFGERF